MFITHAKDHPINEVLENVNFPIYITLIRGVSVVKQHTFVIKMLYSNNLTTLTPLISYTHNGDDTH